MSELDYHEYANLFPMMGGAEFESLVRDIAANGLANPTILLHRDGRILDGRNRYAACKRLGIEIQTATFEGDDKAALAHVVSLNLERRQLTTSQRAAIASEIATMVQGGTGANQHTKSRHANLHVCSDKTTGPRRGVNTREVGKSRKEAAEMMGVSQRSVASAAAVARHAPQIHDMVKAGKVKAHAAEVFVQFAEKDEIAKANDPEQISQAATDIRHSLIAKGAAKKIDTHSIAGRFGHLMRATKELCAISNELREHAYLPSHKFSQIAIKEVSDRLVELAEKMVKLAAKE